MTGQRSWFKSLRPLDKPLTFLAADGQIVAEHVGDIDVETSVNGEEWTRRTWEDVLYIPSLTASLYSTTCREDKGFGFHHEHGRMLITKYGKPLIGGDRNGSSYRPYIRVVAHQGTSMAVQTIDVWHQRLGHVPDDKVRAMHKSGCVVGLDVVGSKHKTCDGCHFGKQPVNPHPSRKDIRDCLPGQRLHTDVCHATIKSLAGSLYFVTMKDEASGYRMVRFIKSTAEVADALKSMMDESERQTGRKALSIRTDNGTEYVNAKVKELFASLDHEKSPAFVKQGNGIAERENRILCDTARSMLFAADLSREERTKLWAEAVYTAAYIRNRIPNNRTGNNTTPHELWFGSKPDVSHLRVFGSTAFVHVPDVKRKKFDAKSRKVVFVGYDWKTTKIFRVFDRENQSVIAVSDVKVEEQEAECTDVFKRPQRGYDTRTTITLPEEDFDAADDDRDHSDESDDSQVMSGSNGQSGSQMSSGPSGHGRPPGTKNKPKTTPLRHPMQTRSKSATQHAMAVALDPNTVDDISNREDSAEWRAAMDDEMESA